MLPFFIFVTIPACLDFLLTLSDALQPFHYRKKLRLIRNMNFLLLSYDYFHLALIPI